MNGVLELKEVACSGRLHPLSLRIQVGEHICLLGSSGAGKSTLIRLANGSLTPDQGHVSWNGTPLNQLSRRRRCEIGTLWQGLLLVEELNVAQNINAGALGSHSLLWALRNLVGTLNQAACREVMIQVGLETDLLYCSVAALSGGQRQRVALARLLRQNASIVLADEPLSALDPALSELVLDRLLLQSSCLVSLHRPDLARRFDRVIGLRDGRLVIDQPAVELSPDELSWLYRRG